MKQKYGYSDNKTQNGLNGMSINTCKSGPVQKKPVCLRTVTTGWQRAYGRDSTFSLLHGIPNSCLATT